MVTDKSEVRASRWEHNNLYIFPVFLLLFVHYTVDYIERQPSIKLQHAPLLAI